MSVDQAIHAVVGLHREQRIWLRACYPFLCDQTPPAASPAVEFARDLVRLAALQRACRIFRSDLPAGGAAAEASATEIARTAEG